MPKPTTDYLTGGSTYQYPAGDGTYVTLDQYGKPVASTGAETFQSKQLWDRVMAGYGRTLGPEMLGPDLSKFDDYTLMAQGGGRIPGVGSGDKQPMMGEPGEFVINKYAARAIGYDNLERMNRIAGGGAGMVEPGRTGYQSRRKEGKITIYTPGQGRRIEGKYQTSTGAPINPVEKWYPGGPPVTAARGPESPYGMGQKRWIIGPYGYPIEIQYTDVGPMPQNPRGTDVASLNPPFATNAPPMRSAPPPTGGGGGGGGGAAMPYDYFGPPSEPYGPYTGAGGEPGRPGAAAPDFGTTLSQYTSDPGALIAGNVTGASLPRGVSPGQVLSDITGPYGVQYPSAPGGGTPTPTPTATPAGQTNIYGQPLYGQGGQPLNPTAPETFPTATPTTTPWATPDLPPISAQEPTTAPYAPPGQELGPMATPYPTETPEPTAGPSAFPTALPGAPWDQQYLQFQAPYGGPSFNEPAPGPSSNYYAPPATPTELPSPPSGPNEFVPNVPAAPGEDVTATLAPDAFAPSTAGADIPTDESMTATLAPDAFGQSELPATPAPEPPPTYQYPSGDGTYSTVGQDGQPVQATPKLSDRPGTLYPDVGPPPLGGFGQPMGYFSPGTAGPGPLPNLYSGGITYNDVLASGVTPSGNWASSVPAPGGLGGIYGQGSYGSMPFWDRLVMRAYLAGRDPSLGFGARSAIGQYAAVSSPGAARSAAPSWATVAPYVAAAPAPLAGRGGAAPSPTLRAPVQGLPYGGGPWTPATAARTTPITRGDIRDANRGIGGPGGRPLSGAP